MAAVFNTFASFVIIAVIFATAANSQVNNEIGGKTGTVQTTSLYPSDALNLVTLGLINGKKYLFVDQDGSWFDASYFCNVHGMDLAVIESAKENDLIKEHIADLGKTSTLFWVGAHRMGRASYHWINGASMIFSDWGPGEPASPGDNCMAISKNSWLDYACNDPETFWRTAFVCEERESV